MGPVSMYEAESDMDVNMAESYPDAPAEMATAAPTIQRSTGEIVDHLEVDSAEERSDADSSIGSEVSSFTTSLKTEEIEYRFEHGRRYQASNHVYALPNDIQEMDRLELQHLIWIEMTGGRYHLAPLHEINLVDALDVGCGTGNWTIEFANQYPNCRVLGTDLSPIQPDYIPVNCTFLIDDASKQWDFHQKFDYIHTRAITFGISDWEKLVSQAWENLQPGGYLELQEMCLPLGSQDGTLCQGTSLFLWGEKITAALGSLGIHGHGAYQHADRLRNRGFQNVNQQPLNVPMGPWAKGMREKRIGWMARKDLVDGIEGISKKLFLMMGDAPEQVDEFLQKCREELMDKYIHAYMPLNITWGQKPCNTS